MNARTTPTNAQADIAANPAAAEHAMRNMRAQLRTLRAQNAELVKALHDARKCCSDMYAAYHAGTPYHKRMTMQDRLAKIDAALAKVQP
jgi:hypothetical protein